METRELNCPTRFCKNGRGSCDHRSFPPSLPPPQTITCTLLLDSAIILLLPPQNSVNLVFNPRGLFIV